MPNSTHATTPQPPPQTNNRPAVWDLVIADMRERDAMGRAKYGTPLQAGNGRDAIVDAYQEALDLAVYLRQEIEERRAESAAAEQLAALHAALGVRSQGEALAQVRALHHAAASGAEVAGEASALREEISAARAAVGEAWFAGEVSLAAAIKRKCAALESFANAGNPAGQRAPEATPPPASGARNPSAVVPACPDCGSVPDGSKCCIVVIPTPSADSGIAPAAVEVGAPASTAEAQR